MYNIEREVIAQHSSILLSLLLEHATELQLPKNKEKILSYILCGRIGLQYKKDTMNHTVSQSDIEIVRDHKRKIKKGTRIINLFTKIFVSRGGEKLQNALKNLKVPVKDKIWLDCGASTGGFTDCLIQKGAKYVYAIDVGYNQFDYTLQKHTKVKVMERTNILALQADSFMERKPHAAVVDVSFRSLTGLLPTIQALLVDGYILALCKPQFEFAYFKHLLHLSENFTGVVENKHLLSVLITVLLALYNESIYVHTILPSTIKGRKGNQEFFFEIFPKKPITQGLSVETYYTQLCNTILNNY